MNKFFCLLVFLTGIALNSSAQLPLNQEKYADSLTHILQQTTSDSTKSRTSFYLSYYWLSSDTLKAKRYLEQGRLYGKKSPYLQALGYYYEAQYFFSADVPKSLAAFMKADKLLSKFTIKEAYQFRSKAWFNYGMLMQHEKNDEFVVQNILNKCIPLAKKAGDTLRVAEDYFELGLILMNNHQYAKAEEYYNTAIQQLKNAPPESPTLLRAYMCAAQNYCYAKKYAPAGDMLGKAKKILSAYPKSPEYPNYYIAEGIYYADLKQYQKALTSYENGIDVARKLNQSYVLQTLLFEKYNTLVALKRYSEALKLVTDLSREKEFMAVVNNRKITFGELAKSNQRMGNMTNAYEWLKKYADLSDSLNDSRVKDNINELEVKYQSAEKQKKIARLQSEQQKASLTAKNRLLTNWLLGVTSLILFIVTAFVILYYRNNKKLAVQKEINYHQQLKEKEQQQQLAVTQAILEGEERERGRVARDLHDGLGGLLAGVKMDISKMGSHATTLENVQQQLQSLSDQLDGSINELRNVARNMMPEGLIKFGLVAALKDFCEGLDHQKTRIVFQSYGLNDADMASTSQITIYRIIQELVTNALKHANASDILVDCIQENNSITITVEDNGSGFNPNARLTNGMGLSNVETRVNYLNGKLDIQSSKKTGTTVTIQFNEHL